MRFRARRVASAIAFAAWLLVPCAPLLSAQAVGPLKTPKRARAADTYVAGEVISASPSDFRVRKTGGSIVTFAITASTDYADGAEPLEPGMYVRVRAITGPGGPMTALTVWALDAGSSETARVNRRIERREKLRTSAKATPPVSPPAAAIDIDDPGPPVLRRRSSGDRSPPIRRKPAEELQWIAEEPQANFEFTPQEEQYDDPLLARAGAVNAASSRLQTDFIATQTIDRFESRTLGRKWKKLDVVEAEVLMIQNEEHYQDLKKNGVERGGDMEDQGGTWSTGEFGTMLHNLFVYGYAERAEKSRGEPDEIGVSYEFKVERRRSGWSLHIKGDDPYITDYDGRFWVDPESSRVTKIEMTATKLPQEFPLRAVVNSVSFGLVAVEGERYWLPLTATAKSCVRHTATCHRNDIRFGNYRKFTAESSIYQTESKVDFGAEAEAETDSNGAPK